MLHEPYCKFKHLKLNKMKSAAVIFCEIQCSMWQSGGVFFCTPPPKMYIPVLSNLLPDFPRIPNDNARQILGVFCNRKSFFGDILGLITSCTGYGQTNSCYFRAETNFVSNTTTKFVKSLRCTLISQRGMFFPPPKNRVTV